MAIADPRSYAAGMSTTKRKPSAKKSAASAPKKKSGRKAAAAKTDTDNLTEQALKFVDEAAALLRTGIREGAKTTAHSREVAKKKAHRLLDQASTSLSHAIEGGASALQKILKKL